MIKGFIKEIGYDKPFKTGELFDQTYDDSFGKMASTCLCAGVTGTLKSGLGKYLGYRKEKPYVHPGWAHGQAAAKGKAGDSVIYRFVQV